MTLTIHNRRINAYGRAVYDVYNDNHFLATVEINNNASYGLKVLLGALQPRGKLMAVEAIRENGDHVPTHYESGGTNGAPLPGSIR